MKVRHLLHLWEIIITLARIFHVYYTCENLGVTFVGHFFITLVCNFITLVWVIKSGNSYNPYGSDKRPIQPFPGNEGMPFFSNNFWLFTLEMIVWVFTGSVLTQNIKKSEKKIWRGPVPLFSRKLRKTFFSKFFGFFDQNWLARCSRGLF